MSKFLLAILLLFATAAVVAHGILIYQVNATATIIAEEETHDHHKSGKDAKDASKERPSFPPDINNYSFAKKLNTAALHKSFSYPKGYYDKPYTPPDVI